MTPMQRVHQTATVTLSRVSTAAVGESTQVPRANGPIKSNSIAWPQFERSCNTTMRQRFQVSMPPDLQFAPLHHPSSSSGSIAAPDSRCSQATFTEAAGSPVTSARLTSHNAETQNNTKYKAIALCFHSCLRRSRGIEWLFTSARNSGDLTDFSSSRNGGAIDCCSWSFGAGFAQLQRG